MKIFIMRHAEAAPGHPDDQRSLTDRGRACLSNCPEGLEAALAQVNQIFVSPYLRTRQTLAAFLPGRDAQLAPWLVPDSHPGAVTKALERCEDQDSILLVSHMPLVAELSSWFTGETSPGFMTAQIEELDLVHPARGLATRRATYYLDR